MQNSRHNTRGVTLTELLVVLLIIAVLATIAVPVYLNRVETARIRTAQQETRELAMAEEMCAVLHSLYVPLQTLDDVPTTTQNNGLLGDDFQNYQGLQWNAVDFVNMTNVAPAVTGQTVTVIPNWQGPFINFHRFWMGYDAGNNRLKTAEVDSDPPEVKTDLPLDPWGQPYRVFSPWGITGISPNITTKVNLFQSAGSLFDEFNLELPYTLAGGVKVLTYTTFSVQRPYDRWAIVSFGPNGVADTPNIATSNPNYPNDDVVYVFGMIRPESGWF